MSNAEQLKSPVESTVKAPLTVFKFGIEHLSKSPLRTTAPSMVLRSSRLSMVFNSVLFSITKPPPMVVKFEKSIFSKSSLFSMVKSPPTVATSGNFKELTEDSKKPAEALIASKLAIEMEVTE